jgi:hypothetical protein
MLEKMGALKSSKAASCYETLIRRESEAMITESVSGRPRLDMSAVREHNRLNRKHLLHSLLPQAITRCEFVLEKRDDSDVSRHEIPSSLSGGSLTRLPRSGDSPCLPVQTPLLQTSAIRNQTATFTQS